MRDENTENRFETIVCQAEEKDHRALLKFTLDEAIEAEGRACDQSLISEAIKAALCDPEEKARYFIARSRVKTEVCSEVSLDQASGHVSVVKEWSDWNKAYYLWITSMYVAPFARGQGVMGALLEAVDDYARALGSPEVRIYVHRENMRGSKAWIREGFVEAPYWMGHREVKPKT